MKSFKKYISEDIELSSDIVRPKISDWKGTQSKFEKFKKLKNLGKIHDDYSIYSHSGGRSFYIVHDRKNNVVGEITNNSRTPNHIEVGGLSVHKNHTKKKIGTSLAVAAYKHLHGLGYTIGSGGVQSIGGASVWQELMNDPEINKHVHALQHPFGGKYTDVKDLGQASELDTGNIWASGSGEIRRAARSKGIVMRKYGSPESERAYSTQLILKAKKK